MCRKFFVVKIYEARALLENLQCLTQIICAAALKCFDQDWACFDHTRLRGFGDQETFRSFQLKLFLEW